MCYVQVKTECQSKNFFPRIHGNFLVKIICYLSVSMDVVDRRPNGRPRYIATEDKMIPPPAQRTMARRAKAQVAEVSGSHANYVSKPDEVAEVIQQAANA
jgi:hypothetical protein